MALNDAAQLEALMVRMNVPDTQAVKDAERQIGVALRDAACVPVLLQLLRFSAHVTVRQLAAVLLRLCMPKFWHKLDPATRVSAKQLLLEALAHERERMVALNATYVVAELSKQESPEEVAQWKELFEFLHGFARSTDPAQQELAMRLFFAMTETVGTVFRPHFAELKQLYENVLQSTTDSRVRVAALKAAGALVQFLSGGEDVLIFRELVPLLVRGLEANLSDDALAVQVLEVIYQLAESPTPILNKHLREVIECLLLLIRSDVPDMGTKHTAAETLGKILECKARHVAKSGAVNALIETAVTCVAWDYPRVVQVLHEMDLTQQQINEQEAEGGDDDDGEDSDSTPLGHVLVSSIAAHLPQKHVFRPLLQAAMGLIQSPNVNSSGVSDIWIGLNVILAAASGVAEQLAQDEVLQPVLSQVLGLARSNQDPIIRASALLCLVDMVETLSPAISSYLPSMLAEALTLLQDPQNFVRNCAGDLVEVICSDIDEELLLPHLERLTYFLLKTAANGANATSQCAALAALGSVMLTAGDAFMPYFDQACQVLGNLAVITDDSLLVVRGQATVTLANLAVTASRERPNGGSNLDRFRPLLPTFVNNLMEGLSTLEDLDVIKCTFTAIGSLIYAFEDEIEPFVEPLAKMLLSCEEVDEGSTISVNDPDNVLVPESVRSQFEATSGSTMTAIDGANPSAEGDDDGFEFSFQPGVSYEISLRLEALYAKQEALKAMDSLATYGPSSAIGRFFEPMAEICLSYATHQYSELAASGVKCLAALIVGLARVQPLPELPSDAVATAQELALSRFTEVDPGRRWLPGLPAPIGLPPLVASRLATAVPVLLDLMAKQKSADVVAACCAALESFAAHFGPGAFGDMFDKVMEQCIALATEQSACQRHLAGNDEDAGDDDDAQSDEQLFENLCDLLGVLAQTCGSAAGRFAPFILGPLVERMHRRPSRRAETLGVCSQFILAMGGPNGAEPFVQDLIPAGVNCLGDENTVAQQNAAFLLGNLILFGGAGLHSDSRALFHVLQALEPLLGRAAEVDQMMTSLREQGREDEMPYEMVGLQAAIDNACGVVARILAVGVESKAIQASQLYPSLLNLLPLRSDLTENVAVFRAIALVCHSDQACVLQAVPQLIHILCATVERMESADGPQGLAMLQIGAILNSLLASPANNVVMQCLSELDGDAAEQLRAVMASK